MPSTERTNNLDLSEYSGNFGELRCNLMHFLQIVNKFAL